MMDSLKKEITATVLMVTVRDSSGRVEFTGLAHDKGSALAIANEAAMDYFGREFIFLPRGDEMVAEFSEDGYSSGTVTLTPTPVVRVRDVEDFSAD